MPGRLHFDPPIIKNDLLFYGIELSAALSAGGQTEQPNASAETSARGGGGGGDPSQRLP